MTFDQFVKHEFFMVFYSIFMWYVAVWSFDKNRLKDKFNWTKWRKGYSDDIILSVVIGFAFVAWDDEIVDGYNAIRGKDFQLDKWMYLLPGVATDILYKIIAWAKTHKS